MASESLPDEEATSVRPTTDKEDEQGVLGRSELRRAQT